MGQFEFKRGNTPYVNRGALTDEYTPNSLVGRDDELEEYHSALEPVIWGETPKNIFLYGKTGVGKTASTKYFLKQLEADSEQYDDLVLRTVFLNCDGLETSYRLCIALVNQMRSASQQISESGYSKSEAYAMLWEELESTAGTVLIVLDEVDHIKSGEDSILYQLSRAHANGNVSDTKIGIIGISNDLTFTDDLSPKVRSSLCERQLHFPTYDATELQDVLQQRADIAFKDDGLDEGVIPLCAAYGAKEAGDARKALDLLLEAGDVARENKRSLVTEDDVNRAQSRLKSKKVRRGIQGLHEHDHYILYALCVLVANGKMPARTRVIYPQYERICEAGDIDPHTSRWVSDHLDELKMLGLLSVTEKNLGRKGGKYRKWDLKTDVSNILESIEETLKVVGVLRSIEPYIPDSLELRSN